MPAPQLEPPLIVRRIVPLSPAAQPFCPSKKCTEFRFDVVFVNVGIQNSPPSFVIHARPREPTATPRLLSKNARSLMSSREPSDKRCQLKPLSSVLMISPLSPTPQPVKRSAMWSETILGFVLILNGSHVAPPSPVTHTMPAASLIDPLRASEKHSDSSSARP